MESGWCQERTCKQRRGQDVTSGQWCESSYTGLKLWPSVPVTYLPIWSQALLETEWTMSLYLFSCPHTFQHRVPDSANDLKTLKQSTEGKHWQSYFIGQIFGSPSGLLVKSSQEAPQISHSFIRSIKPWKHESMRQGHDPQSSPLRGWGQSPWKCPQIRMRPGTVTNSLVVHHIQVVFLPMVVWLFSPLIVNLSGDKGYWIASTNTPTTRINKL